MAYYLVTAKPKPDRLPNLLRNLQERAYFTMRPFGRSLTYSLENARLRDDGYAVWEEEDYCSPPLAQERAAALDEFFDECPHFEVVNAICRTYYLERKTESGLIWETT